MVRRQTPCHFVQTNELYWMKVRSVAQKKADVAKAIAPPLKRMGNAAFRSIKTKLPTNGRPDH